MIYDIIFPSYQQSQRLLITKDGGVTPANICFSDPCSGSWKAKEHPFFCSTASSPSFPRRGELI